MKRTIPEKVFKDEITLLVSNLFANNINFRNNHYMKVGGVSSLIGDIKMMAEMILHKIEQSKHLINLDEEDSLIDDVDKEREELLLIIRRFKNHAEETSFPSKSFKDKVQKILKRYE